MGSRSGTAGSSPHGATTLARFFEGACPHVTGGGFHARGAMRIARASELPRLSVLVADVHGRPGAPASEFVLFLHPPDVPVHVCEATLRALHELTRMEARIAALLVGGQPVARIAGEVGSRTNTVRTHLKRVFAKLDVANQSALIRAVLSDPAALQLGGERSGSRVATAGLERHGRAQGAPE